MIKPVHFLLLTIVFSAYKSGISQNVIGVPSIINYTKENYGAGNQNWDITQDKRGIMYFANNDGMLTFDGVYWQLYRLPNGTGLHSVIVAKDGKIYVGGQGEIGYFKADENGRLHYFSLNKLLSAGDNNFADVWNICEKEGHVLFRVNSKIFDLYKGRITSRSSAYWSFLGKAGDRVFAHDADKGLLQFEDGKWAPLPWGNLLPQGTAVRSVLAVNKDSLLIVSQQFGLFIIGPNGFTRFISPDIENIVTQSIYQALILPNKNLLIATRLGGCYILNSKGNLIERITKNEGLQSQNVLSAKVDREGNIWLGLDNGVDIVSYSDAIKHIFPENENHNTGFASAIYRHHLYLGTSAGVYTTPLHGLEDISKTKGKFERVKNTRGEVWGLYVVRDILWLAHAGGAYYIRNNEAILMDKSVGYWNFQPYSNNNAPDRWVIAGTYNRINFFDVTKGAVTRLPIFANTESARFIVQHNGIIWMGHPYRGLFQVIPCSGNQVEYKPYTDKKGIITPNNNRIFKIKNKLILTNDNGVFEYDQLRGGFIKSVFFEKLFGKQLVNYLLEDRYGNIWFVQGRKIGVAAKSSGFKKPAFFRELENKFTYNFEHINVIDSSNVLIAAEKGFFHLNLKSYSNKKRKPLVLIRTFKTLFNDRDSLIFGGYAENKKAPSFPYSKKGIYINFAALEYSHPDDVEYSFMLGGFDKEWSEWNTKTEKEFNNLPSGHYTFYVKCRMGEEVSEPAEYSFTILPPWYQSWWARLIYILSGIGLLYLVLKLQQKRHQREQRKKLLQQKRDHEEKQRNLKLLHELEVQENEKKIIQLNADKLQIELDHKNQELASSAMSLVRRMEVMGKLKEDLQAYKSIDNQQKSIKEFQKIIRTIDKEIDHQQEWEQFAIHFDKVHNNFLQHLKAAYPALSGNDLKLCAYLKLNISTKEIAQLMNISVRGVETARFRLRKKLSLSGDTNLTDFLIGFNGNG